MRGNWLALAVLAIGVACGFPQGAGAQIVYDHGSDIWAMNDDGSGKHAIVHAFGFPGPGLWTIGGPDVLSNGNAVVFTATTNAYNDGSSGPPGGCGLVCSGTYRLQNGKLTRLSPAPTPCGASQQWCTSFETAPRLTANGLVAYDYFLTTWEYSCATFPCEWAFIPGGSVHELDTRSATNGSGRAQWKRNPATQDGLSLDPIPTPDPANASLMAYANDAYCASPPCANPYDVHVGDRNGGNDRTVVFDDAPFVSLAWVPDGSALIDVEAGTQAGIWAYAPTPASTPNKNFIWLLADPKPYNPGNPFSTSIDQARYMGSGKVLLSQNGDLYTIPLTACAKKATSSAAGCTMANAHRLTTGGNNREGVWTANNTRILGYGEKLALTLSVARGQSVRKQGGLSGTATCSLPCAFAAGGVVKIGSRVYKTKTIGGSLAAARPTRFTLKLSSAALKAIGKALKAHKRVVAAIEVEGNPGNGTVTRTASFAVSK